MHEFLSVNVIRSVIHSLGNRTVPLLLCSCLTFPSNQFPTSTTGDTHSTRRYAGDVNTATFCKSGLVCTSPDGADKTITPAEGGTNPPSLIDLWSWVNLVKHGECPWSSFGRCRGNNESELDQFGLQFL